MKLRRFWVELDWGDVRPLTGAYWGFGITGYDEDDALQLLDKLVFDGLRSPEVKRLVADVDVSTLDANHVRPNIGNVLSRGIWFPMGYS